MFNYFIFSRAFCFVARAYKNIIIHENFPLGETVLLLSFVNCSVVRVLVLFIVLKSCSTKKKI